MLIKIDAFSYPLTGMTRIIQYITRWLKPLFLFSIVLIGHISITLNLKHSLDMSMFMSSLINFARASHVRCSIAGCTRRHPRFRISWYRRRVTFQQ